MPSLARYIVLSRDYAMIPKVCSLKTKKNKFKKILGCYSRHKAEIFGHMSLYQ